MKLRGTLAPGEEVLIATRSQASALLPALWEGLGAVLAFSFASTISADSSVLAWAGYFLATFFSWKCLRRVVRWGSTGFFLTNSRVVIQRGFGTSSQVSLPLAVIEGVDVRPAALRGADGAHLHLYVQGEVHVLRSVPRGHDFSHEIRGAQNRLMQRLSWSAMY